MTTRRSFLAALAAVPVAAAVLPEVLKAAPDSWDAAAYSYAGYPELCAHKLYDTPCPYVTGDTCTATFDGDCLRYYVNGQLWTLPPQAAAEIYAAALAFPHIWTFAALDGSSIADALRRPSPSEAEEFEPIRCDKLLFGAGPIGSQNAALQCVQAAGHDGVHRYDSTVPPQCSAVGRSGGIGGGGTHQCLLPATHEGAHWFDVPGCNFTIRDPFFTTPSRTLRCVCIAGHDGLHEFRQGAA